MKEDGTIDPEEGARERQMSRLRQILRGELTQSAREDTKDEIVTINVATIVDGTHEEAVRRSTNAAKEIKESRGSARKLVETTKFEL